MFNDCIEAYFDQVLGLPFEQLHRDGCVPTVQISATFTAPSRHGDRITRTLDCLRVGRSSVDLCITAAEGEQQRFASNSTLVMVDGAGSQ